MKWWRNQKRDADLARELQSDLDLETEEQLERGVSPEEAPRAARRAFGNVPLIQERTRETWTLTPFEQLMREVRYALRQLRKAPGFAFTAVFTLAIGLGSASAIFCLIDTLWLHPMHVPHPGQIVRVFSTTPQDQEGAFSYFEYQALAQRMPAFSGLAAVGGRGSLMPRPDGTSLLLLTNVVSSNFFDVLGVRPQLGRLFTAADAADLRVHPAVVLGNRCWQRDFHADPSIIGKFLPLRHGKDLVYQVQVLGVLPPRFREIDPNSDRDVWMPAEVWAANVEPSALTGHAFRWFNLVGRLAPGSTAAEANAQAAAVASALQQVDPANNHSRGARALSDFAYRMSQAGTSGIVLFAIVAGVVLLSTVNVAHLLLARAHARVPEVALRLSLGATRVVIARQLLIENLLLGLLGWAAGLALAAAIVALLPRLLVSEPAMLNSLGSGTVFQLDWRFFCVAGILAVVTMLLLALVPLAQVARPQLVPALQSGLAGRLMTRASIARRAAVWLQIAVSFALLVSTGALVRSFLNTQTRPIGLTRDQVLVAFTQDPDDAIRQTIVTNLRALPGIRAVAYGIRSPMMPSESGIAVHAMLPSHPELREPLSIKFNAVSPGFLEITGTHILRGRGFTTADDQAGPLTVLINRTMADKYFPGSDPLGQVVRIDSGTAAGFIEARILGVTEDAPIDHIGELPEPFLYVPFHQYATRLSNMGEMTLVLSTAGNAMSLAQPVRQALIHIHPLLDPMFVTSQPELLRFSAGNYQMMAELVTALGCIGLALTVVGLYGFLAFRVTQRGREIGIRMALGATRQATAMLVVADTARMAAIGLALGLALAFLAARIEAAVLFGVSPLDALSLAAAVAILAFALIAAAWLPARRAASIQPMEALRNE
ncbi:MAG TPA: ADOP family duplicated permease [Terracidiphilus sp.]|nr:ADOP family duplicated permease [Terracidiphilus sp.]